MNKTSSSAPVSIRFVLARVRKAREVEIRGAKSRNRRFNPLGGHGIQASCHIVRQRSENTTRLLQGRAGGESLPLGPIEVVFERNGDRQQLKEDKREKSGPAI